MSLKRSFLSRRITSKSFSLSKSFKESKTLEIAQKIPQSSSNEEENGVDRESVSVSWSTMLPELLGEIIRRVEATEDQWPLRQNVVACGCVCKSWREVTREIVRSPLHGGKITFPSSLKQVGFVLRL